MYSRKLEGRTLTFGHEGILYKNSFVMYDRETGSLWVHTTGQAVRGPLQGRQLRFLPSQVTTWGRWRSEYPNTLVLPGRRAEGMMGSFDLTRNRNRYGLSVGHGTQVKLYPFALLPRDGVLNDEVDGLNVVIVIDGATGMGSAFERGDRRFRAEGGGMVDQDGRVWDRLQGTSGELRLEPVPATPWLIDRWRAFFRPEAHHGGPGRSHEGGQGGRREVPPQLPPGSTPMRRPSAMGWPPANGFPGARPTAPFPPPGLPPHLAPRYISRPMTGTPGGMHHRPFAQPPY